MDSRRSRNSHMRSPRRVTLQPIAWPSRTWKPAMDFLARVTQGLLARDDAHIVHSCVELLESERGFADAHIHNDLLKTRNLVDVVDSELALQLETISDL